MSLYTRGRESIWAIQYFLLFYLSVSLLHSMIIFLFFNIMYVHVTPFSKMVQVCL